MARYLRAFSDLYFTEEATLTQDDRIALFWTARGTHRGKMMNIPPIEYIKERALRFQQIQA
jgi:predicted ester cyclase